MHGISHGTNPARGGRAGWRRRIAFAGVGLACGAALACAAPLAALADDAAANGSEGAAVAATSADADATEAETAATAIELSDDGVLVDGTEAGEDDSAAVYVANDVVYYEDRDTYDSGNAYGEGGADERHTAEEAAAVTVVHITEPGTYRVSGTLSNGQIAIDLGEDAAEDPEAVVTLVLDGVDVTCDVAPAIVFYNVYECDGDWSTETATAEVDTSAAGANVVLADGSVNTVTGSHVARIYKDNSEQKKLWKIDGAFYSFMSMNVDGEDEGTGTLTITADNEGLDSELHLTINGGNINIFSQDDGINTNEDGVSVTTINGGNVHILGGLGAEGDGIDSNGYLVINGGTVIAMANPGADSGLDSDMGSYINGGTVVALGSTIDWAESDSDQVTMNLQFASAKNAGDAIVVTDEDGTVVFAYDPSEDEVAGAQIRTYSGAVLSCENFAVGDTYQVYIGGVVTGDEVGGVYDASTVTVYEGGAQQSYTGTDVMGGPGGMGGMGGFGGPGGGMGGQGGPGEMGEMGQGGPGQQDGQMEPPSGDAAGAPAPGETDGQQGEMGEMGEPPAMPDGADGEGADGQPAAPDNADGGQGGPGQQGGAGETGEPPAVPDGADAQGDGSEATSEDGSSSADTAFYMTDKVNAFSGVDDA